MQPFTTLKAVAVPLDEANLDTNQLSPTRFTRRARGPGYEIVLLHQWRFRPDGSENPDFIMNRPAYRPAQIIVGARNFGCGSSREMAVWALSACGFRALIAPSYGDLFYNNCFKNGVLPVVLPEAVCTDLRGQLHAKPGAEIAVDLPNQAVTGPDGKGHAFEVQAFPKHCLLNGLDDIGITLQHEQAIAAFETRYRAAKSWLF
ncbi:MAG: 3-isopropylmalate dehydratase small subunit [Candidatus Lambdaproteobacteria bacterium]|nr:3-isopropylmalate dehydratase small subunit [Candidatus Lambdaproteobacteria bacterium]